MERLHYLRRPRSVDMSQIVKDKKKNFFKKYRIVNFDVLKISSNSVLSTKKLVHDKRSLAP